MVAPALLPNRTIINKRGHRGLANLHVSETLEDVRDHLRKMVAAQQVEDHTRSFSQMLVTFEDDYVRARAIDNPEDAWIVSKNAFSQMDTSLLPRSGGNFLMELSALTHPASRKAATATWAMFAENNDKPRVFRTVLTRMPDGSIQRILRAQVSTGYGMYSNLQFVEDLLDNTDIGELRMLDWRIDDDAMRFRVGAPGDGPVEVDVPFPMYSFWNSETGQSKTRINGGLFRPNCLNGMGSWEKDKKVEFGWKHYGNTDRISQGVGSAMREISTSNNGTLDGYIRARDIFIDDAFAFVDQMLHKTGIKKEAIEAIKTRGMTDPTSNSADSLAGVVDGITLIAQDEHRGLIEMDLMEQIAADVMRRGLAKAKADRILVHA
jgi:hypothetical protein